VCGTRVVDLQSIALKAWSFFCPIEMDKKASTNFNS